MTTQRTSEELRRDWLRFLSMRNKKKGADNMTTRAQQAQPMPKQGAAEPNQEPPTYGPGGEWGSIPKKTFQPFGSLIAIHVFRESTTPSGLLMPDGGTVGGAMMEETEKAVVIACGPTCVQIKEEDVVLIHAKVQCAVVKHKGNKVVILREESVTGVIKTAEQFREMGEMGEK